MRKRSRWAVAALLAAGLMAVAAGGAHANRLSINEIFFRMTWNGVFRLSDAGGVAECRVTLEGTFHSSTYVKVTSLRLGYMTRATMNECRGASAGFLTERLPWHVQYESFAGRLPEITALNIRFVEASIWLRTGVFVSCLALSSTANPFKMSVTRTGEGNLTVVRLVEEPIPYQSAFGCTGLSLIPLSSGTGEMTRFETSGRITLRLI